MVTSKYRFHVPFPLESKQFLIHTSNAFKCPNLLFDSDGQLKEFNDQQTIKYWYGHTDTTITDINYYISLLLLLLLLLLPERYRICANWYRNIDSQKKERSRILFWQDMYMYARRMHPSIYPSIQCMYMITDNVVCQQRQGLCMDLLFMHTWNATTWTHNPGRNRPMAPAAWHWPTFLHVDFCPISTLDMKVDQLVNTFTPADASHRVAKKRNRLKWHQTPGTWKTS